MGGACCTCAYVILSQYGLCAFPSGTNPRGRRERERIAYQVDHRQTCLRLGATVYGVWNLTIPNTHTLTSICYPRRGAETQRCWRNAPSTLSSVMSRRDGAGFDEMRSLGVVVNRLQDEILGGVMIQQSVCTAFETVAILTVWKRSANVAA